MASWRSSPVESEARKRRLRYFVKLAQTLMNPPLASPTFQEIMSLHRYFLAANQHRVAFQDLVTSHAREHGKAPTYGGENWNESWIAMSYWYGGLYVVVEGWQELGLADPQVDSLLASPNVALLKRYRNGIFHYQRVYFDERFQELIREGTNVVEWVAELNRQFGRFFLEWFDQQQREGGSWRH